MKHGDQVNTPKGLGIYFEDLAENKAYVVLKEPTEDKVFIPLVEPVHHTWEAFPCDTLNRDDLTVDKTYEERQLEAHHAAKAAQEAKQAEIHRRMAAHQEALRRAHEQQNNQNQN